MGRGDKEKKTFTHDIPAQIGSFQDVICIYNAVGVNARSCRVRVISSEDLYARVAKVDDDNMAVGGHADP
jgi:hypothetical protein